MYKQFFENFLPLKIVDKFERKFTKENVNKKEIIIKMSISSFPQSLSNKFLPKH